MMPLVYGFHCRQAMQIERSHKLENMDGGE
jgi:hypothetical protein